MCLYLTYHGIETQQLLTLETKDTTHVPCQSIDKCSTLTAVSVFKNTWFLRTFGETKGVKKN